MHFGKATQPLYLVIYMNTLPNCPFCSHKVLRHISRGHVYWFCQHCHQEVPVFKITNPIPIRLTKIRN
jgi:ribosomal protein L37AE/L43A